MKIVLSVRQGKCAMNVLYSSMSKLFVLRIYSRNPIKWIHLPFLQEYVQSDASHVKTLMTLWKRITIFRSSSWYFSSPHYVKCFICRSPQTFTKNVASEVSFREKVNKYAFLCFFFYERLLFLMERKYKRTFPKTRSSLGDIIFLCTFLL